MTNNIEAMKSIIRQNEQRLKTETNEGEKARLISDIEAGKNMLLEKYRDTTYSTAMDFNEYETWIKTQGTQQKHKTGISFIDNIFNGDGIQEESFINLVGASGAGKSTLGLRILLNVAKHSQAYFISLEMGRFKTYNKIRSMIENDEQRKNLQIEVWSDDLDKVIRDIELYAYNGCKFFLIDSKMKISVKGKEPTHEKISKLSSALSRLTQKHGIIIILINQVSEENLRNKVISLKGSGDQLYDSDLLISIEYDKKDKNLRIFNLYKNRQNDIRTKIKYGLDFREEIAVEVGTVDHPICL